MFNKIILVFSFAFLVKEGKANQDNLVALGTVEGKSYFANGIRELNSTYFSWTTAKSYCEAKSMKLATIDSEAQAEFLKSVYDPLNFNGWFWVAAKYNTSVGWSWVETGKKVQSYSKVLLWKTMPHGINPQHCLCYSSNSHEKGYYFQRACHHLHHVLCETLKPSGNFSNLVTKNNQGELKIIDIGTINGTTYYGDKVLRNWNEAWSFCLKNGMLLATLREQARGNFLKDACYKINFDGYFWVLGNDGAMKEPSHDQCPNYKPHNNVFSYKMCVNKYFTLCEAANPSNGSSSANDPYVTEDITVPDWDSDQYYEEEELEKGIKEENFAEAQIKQTVVCICDNGSRATLITIIFILIVVIIGLLIWKSKLWARISHPTSYLSVKRFPNVNFVNRNTASATELINED